MQEIGIFVVIILVLVFVGYLLRSKPREGKDKPPETELVIPVD